MIHQVDSNLFSPTADRADVTGSLPTTAPQQGDREWDLLTKINALLNAGPSGAAAVQVMSIALEASHVLKASAGKLHGLSVFNSSGSAQFILIMDANALPADGPVTLLYPPVPIAAGSILAIDFPRPVAAGTGIVVCNSSTGTFTKTLGGADCAFFAHITD